jgi:hypothetical protein
MQHVSAIMLRYSHLNPLGIVDQANNPLAKFVDLANNVRTGIEGMP